jgi:hypothetical protein
MDLLLLFLVVVGTEMEVVHPCINILMHMNEMINQMKRTITGVSECIY